MSKRIAKKLLLIGWDSADWKIINPLLDAGKMPALERLINGGVIGNLATLDPPLSPVLWTSIATGKRADKHGILGFVEPNPEIGGIRPVNVTSRTCKAIWNILHQQGMRSNVISWWPSHPAEPINGVMVSNYYSKIDNPDQNKWIMPEGTIHPESVRNEYFKLRVHLKELTGDILLPFIPNLAGIDQEKDTRVLSLARFVAQSASIHAATTRAIRTNEWDFSAVYFDAIDHICHGYMKYTPPKVATVSDEDFETYQHVVEGMYLFHDMMLDRYLELIDDDTIVMLISDHGFNSEHMRLAEIPHCNTAPAFEHSPFGIFCINGPGIKKDERVYGATLLDIAPTILTCFGLPVGEDMDGKVLTSVFEEATVPESISSWEDIEGDCGMHDENTRINTHESAEALKQLVELGYIEDPGEDNNLSAEKAIREDRYNLAKIKAIRRNHYEALSDFEQLYSEDNSDIRFNLELIKLYMHFKRFSDARRIMTNLAGIKDSTVVEFDMLNGIILFNEGKHDEALTVFQSLSELDIRQPGIRLQLALIYTQVDSYDEAIEHLIKELEIDENNALAHYHLGHCYLQTGQYEKAADSLLDSIGLNYSLPAAHYYLGIALYVLGKFDEASGAFNVFLTMAPSNLNARLVLARIMEQQNSSQFQIINNQISQMKKGEIIIVSGLPRSGTSMMMQMLRSAGVELLTDEIRNPDENNPKGYYEFEPVKSLARDSSWMAQADGKAVKVIAQLLKFLPDGFTYKVVFMKRNLNEVLASQQKMLGKDSKVFPMAIAETFKKEVARLEGWFATQPNMTVYFADYGKLVADPMSEAAPICTFLNLEAGSAEKMVMAIDASLHRNKA